MVSWPTSLNKYAWLRAGYGFSPETGVLRTPKSSGRARQRRDMVCTDVLVDASCIFQNDDFDIFIDFFNADLSGGADEFTGPFYDGGGMRDVTMEIVGGVYSADRLLPKIVQVSFQLLVKDRIQVNANLINDLIDGNISLDDYLAGVSS